MANSLTDIAMASVKEEDRKEIPEIIQDHRTNTAYKRLRFFGKGEFSKCYEISDMKTGDVFACKIVSKKTVTDSQKLKLAREIKIHSSLRHKHVVGFHGHCEDDLNVYMVLELCNHRSMMELHKRRKAITEPETRFYMHKILLGVQYLHGQKIIHRNLELGNLFLDANFHVKIGGFSRAAHIINEGTGDTNETLCGTPHHIAPEILAEEGYSLQEDVWSLGCIMYTLLVGKPPFETSSRKDTQKRIKQCKYSIPSNVREPAAAMIKLQLQSNPTRRPSVDKLLEHEFFTSGIMPAVLPVSCLTTAPRIDQLEGFVPLRKPLNQVNGEHSMSVDAPVRREGPSEPTAVAPTSHREHFSALRDQLQKLLTVKCRPEPLSDDVSDPAAQPLVWISKWTDYSGKYGFGYQLCDDSVGVMFNDTTKLIMLANAVNVHYINRQGQEQYMTLREYPPELDKKMTLLKYFRRYMSEKLMKAGASAPVQDTDRLSRLPHLHQWYRTSLAVIMYLTNGILQINFNEDHTKIVLCPLMGAVTYIDTDKNFRTFRFTTLEEHGCDKRLHSNLTYALEKINSIIAAKKSIPSNVREPAAAMIKLQLQSNPTRRPSVDKLLEHEFFTSGIMPAVLPVSCLTTAPRIDQLEGFVPLRKPLNQVNGEHSMSVDAPVRREGPSEPTAVAPTSHREHFSALRDQLWKLLTAGVKCRPEPLSDDVSDPAVQPLVWVTKWAVYRYKYGFGYQLCDDSVGVMFKDTTKLIMLANAVNVHYINRQGQEQYMTLREYPPELDKKMTLLKHFRRCMSEKLKKTGASAPVQDTNGLTQLPHLHQWYRTSLAVMMYLTNGILQINFKDHSKIILCPLMGAVTYIDTDKNFRTFRFTTLEEHGCDKRLHSKLTYALGKINFVLASRLCWCVDCNRVQGA